MTGGGMSNLEPLEAGEYAGVRQAVLNITTAIATLPLELIDRLILTVEQLHTPETRAKMVAAGDLTLDQIEAAKRGVDVELRTFRIIRQARASVELLKAEALRLSEPSNVLEVPHVSKRANGAANKPEEGANDDST